MRSGPRAAASSPSRSASPTFRPRPISSRPASRRCKDGHHGYTPANGIPEVRQAVADDLNKRHGVTTVDPNNVLIVPGGKVTMYFAIMMFGEPGAEIIYPNPGFPIYESTIKFSGATPVPLPLLEENGFGFKAEDVLSRITPKTRLIIVNSPANPTGGIVEKDEIDKLVKGLEEAPQRRHHVGRDLFRDAL